MPRFEGIDLKFRDNQKVILGDNDDHEIYWDGTALVGIDVINPASNNEIARYDENNAIQGSLTTLDNSGNLNINGDFIVGGGQIGITADPDLLSMAAGALTVNGTLTATGIVSGANGSVFGDTRIGSEYVEVNANGSGNRNAYIDLVGDDTYSDYGLRIQRVNTGANASTYITHRGTGNLQFITDEAGPMIFQTDSATRMTIGSAGEITLTNNLRVDGGQIGLTADPDLLSMATDVLTINGNVRIETTSHALYNGVGGTTKLAVTGDSSSTDVDGNTDASISIINTDDTTDNTTGLHFAWQDTDGSPNYAGASIVAQLGEKVAGQYPSGSLHFLTSSATNQAPTEKLTIAADGVMTLTNDLQVDGGQIGITADPDLISMGANALTINGNYSINRSAGADPIGIYYNRQAGQWCNTWYQSSGSNRWRIGVTNAAESGGNVGTDYVINRRDDAGNGIADALFIRRSTGDITIAADLRVDGGHIGITTDPDLISMAANALTVNGDLTLGHNSVRTLTIGGNDTNYGFIGWHKETGNTRGAYMGYGTPGTFFTLAIEDGNYFMLSAPTVRMTGDLYVDGGQIGITTDPDLISMAANALTVNGTLTATGVITGATHSKFGDTDIHHDHIAVNEHGSGNRGAWIDLVGDDTYTDYGLRLIRSNTGPNTPSYLRHKGTGNLEIETDEAAAILFKTNSVTRMTIAAAGSVSLSSGTGINEFSTDGTLTGDSDNAVPTEKAVKTYADAAANPVSAIIAIADNAVPSGYIECNGAPLNTTSYAALFAKIGYMYGGSGASFNIPDYRGEFLRGFANGDATDPDRAARTDRGDTTTGDNVGTKQGHQLDSHRHDGTQRDSIDVAPGTHARKIKESYTGYTGGNETRPTNVYVIYCIKY